MQSSASNPTGAAEEPLENSRAEGSRAGHSFLDRERIDGWCEKGILGCVLAILVFGPLAFGAVRATEFAILLGLAALMMSLWAVRLALRTQYRVLLAPFCFVVALFTGYVVWHYTRADIEYLARIELLQVLLYAVLFFAVLDNLNRQESIQIVLFTLVFAGMANAVYAIYQYFTDSQWVLMFAKPKNYFGRGSGTYICPNHLAGYLEMVLPIAVAYTIAGRLKALPKIFLGYAAAVILAGIGVTISRAGYLSIGLALAVLFVSLLWNRDFRLPALGLLILLLVAGSFFGFRSVRSEVRFATLNAPSSRELFWDGAIKVWKADFWLGVGPNHYDWRFRKHRHWQAQKRPVYAHNDYLNTLADYGTVGMSIIGLGIALLGWGVFRSWKYVRRSNEIATKPSNRSAVVLGCSAGLLAILFHSAADFNMHIPANAAVAVTLMAILTTHLRFATERFWVNPGWIGRVLGILLLLGGISYFSMQAWRLGREGLYLNKAEKLVRLPEQRIDLLKKASAVEPANFDTTLAIGEIIRLKGWKGNEGWESHVTEALAWFRRTIELNRWDSHGYVKAGMCLHWLNKPAEATGYFNTALEIDPEGVYVITLYGWHLLQLGQLEAARGYFEKNYFRDPTAKNYFELVQRKLAEQQQTP